MNLTEKQMADYNDKENCFGKMFDEKETDCTSCVDCDICRELIAGEKPKAVKETPKPVSKMKVTREIVNAIFGEVMNKRDIKFEVVSAANHDKLYIDGEYLGKATTTALYIHGDDSVKYSDMTVDDVTNIFENIEIDDSSVEVTEPEVGTTKKEMITESVLTMYSAEDIRKMTIGDFLRWVMQ
jgi:hypothetical protein